MDWSSILGAAIGGGVGALLGSLAGRLTPEKYRAIMVTIFAVAFAVVGGQAGAAFFGQSPQARIEARLLGDADVGGMASAWRESDPASFRVFLQRLSAPNGGGVDGARAQILAAAAPGLKRLDDAHTVEMIRVARDEMHELSTTHPTTCHPMFNSQPMGDIRAYLSAGVKRREVALLEAAFRTPPDANPPGLEGEALTSAVTTIATQLRTQVGDDITLLASGANIARREPRYCEVVVAFYDHMLALPETDAAKLMRGLARAEG